MNIGEALLAAVSYDLEWVHTPEKIKFNKRIWHCLLMACSDTAVVAESNVKSKFQY